MGSVTYTALRKLAPGHTLDTEYTIDFDAQEVNPSDKETSNSAVALGGADETTLIRIEEFYQVVSAPTLLYDEWQEFLFSVAGRKVFDFDPYYKSDDDDYNPIEVFMVSKGQPARFGKNTGLWVFSFTVRVAAALS